MSKRLYRFIGFAILIVLLPEVVIWAAPPNLISFQGELIDEATGDPLAGPARMAFRIFDAEANGHLLWEEVHASVELEGGVYDVMLGGGTTMVGRFDADLFSSPDRWLEVTVAVGAAHPETLSPRQRVTSVAFALRAADADALDGLDAMDLDQSAHVTDTSNPHRLTAYQVGAIATETDPTVPAALKDGVDWTEVGSRPSGLDDGDDVGITTETDPTVLPSVKDGVTWNEVGGRPPGLDDGDQVGLMVENDPQVGANTTDYVPRWNGSELVSGSLYDTGAQVAIGTSSPASAGLTVESPARTYGIHVDNPGGALASHGLYANAENDDGSAYALFAKAQSTSLNAYGLQLDTDALGSGNAHAIYAFSNTAGSGSSYGAELFAKAADGRAYGLSCLAEVSSPDATDNVYGISGEAHQYGSGFDTNAMGLYGASYHFGAQGESTGLFATASGSDTGDAIGTLSRAYKSPEDTAGHAYGGYVVGDNDRPGGISYGLYSRATGENGRRYGIYSDVTTSGTDPYINYGIYSQVSNMDGHVYGFFGNVDSYADGIAYGAYLDARKTGLAEQDLFGLHVNAVHAGNSGNVYGIYAACDGSNTNNQYAGYFHKLGGGDYAGVFYGNVHVNGTLTATSKSFVQPHKTDSTKEVVYVSLESREHAVMIRGNATLENGEVVIEMPEDWVNVTAADDITVNVTPKGQWAPLYVKSESKSEIVVAVAPGGPDDVTFSYCIMAPRDGFQNHQPIQENKHFTAHGTSAWEFENRYTQDTQDNRAIREMLEANGIMNPEGVLNMDRAVALGWELTPNEENDHYRKAHGMAPLDDHSAPTAGLQPR